MKRLVAILALLCLGICPLFADPTAAPASADQVLYPKGSAQASPQGGSTGSATVIVALALAAAGGWLLWRNKQMAKTSTVNGSLRIAETRSLGSKQYLVVATYGSQKFLLGVCPGTINLLTPLGDATSSQAQEQK